MRTDVVGQLEPRFGREGRLDTEPLELEHPGESISHRSVVVHDQNCARRLIGDAGGRSNHCIILKAKDMARQGRARLRTVSLYNCQQDTL